jgi:hypothetical protein
LIEKFAASVRTGERIHLFTNSYRCVSEICDLEVKAKDGVFKCCKAKEKYKVHIGVCEDDNLKFGNSGHQVIGRQFNIVLPSCSVFKLVIFYNSIENA